MQSSAHHQLESHRPREEVLRFYCLLREDTALSPAIQPTRHVVVQV